MYIYTAFRFYPYIIMAPKVKWLICEAPMQKETTNFYTCMYL